MGDDLDRAGAFGAWVDRSEAALQEAGARSGSLRATLRGDDQIKRVATESGWQWVGDFGMSMAAQTVVGACLGEAFLRAFGPPGVVAGESMGECAAYSVAGALPVEQAAVLAYRWARALKTASDGLGLRMAVVEDVAAVRLAPLMARYDAVVVVVEAPRLVVLSVPIVNLSALQREVQHEGGNLRVSSNDCVAHDPRLRAWSGVWEEHEAFLRGLPLRAPTLPIVSAVGGRGRLRTTADLLDNLVCTTSTRVEWSMLIRNMPALDIRHVWQLGVPTKPYALEKLRSEDPVVTSLRVRAIRTASMIARASWPPST
jgi:acyl transferase domain-containing protein